MNVGLTGNMMFMNYIDQKAAEGTNTNFVTTSYTGAASLRFETPLSVNIGGGVSTNTPEDVSQTSTTFSVFSSKIGYKFLEKRLNAFMGMNMVLGSKNPIPTEEDPYAGLIDNTKMTIKLGAQYKISKTLSLGANIDYISLSDRADDSKNYSELKGKVKLKVGF
jgi:hypothetical protein